MPRKPEILIQTALFSEAKPIISYFKLRQYETQPYKVFRGGNIILLVSGVGGENTQKALNHLFGNNDLKKIKMALNIGMAGCSDSRIPIGSLFCTNRNISGISGILLKTFDTPVTQLETESPCLVDMEGAYFLEILKSHVPLEKIFILKVVSDYLDDSIRKSVDIYRVIHDSIPQWELILDNYPEKMESVINQTPYENLGSSDQKAIRNTALEYRFTHQELKQIIDMALDFTMWDEDSITEILAQKFNSRKEIFGTVKKKWEELKNRPKSYKSFKGCSDVPKSGKKPVTSISRETPGFGRCPVASERTRCCNLLTLDAVEGCGFDCSYCSIRYFYDGNSVGIDEGFIEKLRAIDINPQRSYHIGTGQSSDSLMWGNKAGILDAVLDFSVEHPNIILELKTKSDNISHLMSRDVPANVITTWSLNTDVVIKNEEHFTASLEKRLGAAERMTEKGCLVGFHFHPMVYYDGWKSDYASLFTQIQNRFQPDDVALISLGTLTFIKPVIKKMRERNMKSKILQMPLEDAEGKYSYPLEIKRDMFRFAYDSFSNWHNRVFFYMCMEDAGLWGDVFGYEYADNEEFETAMIGHYEEKIREKNEKCHS